MAVFNEPVDINGGNDLSIRNTSDVRTAHLTGEGALGLSGALDMTGGNDLSIYNANDIRTVHLTGDGSLGLRGALDIYDGNDLSIRNTNRERTVHLTGDGAVGLGGHGGDGSIELYNASGDETIKINAGTGDILLRGADCAELFEIAELQGIDPGTVLIIDEDALLRPCEAAYDRRVAGIVSGAGGLRPGVMLGAVHASSNQVPVALTGKAFCKVDAQYGTIKIGDLLTSSPTPGHAMKASDSARAFGTVIGKALQAHDAGQGLIPVLVALQ
jgi:hypothetical protein